MAREIRASSAAAVTALALSVGACSHNPMSSSQYSWGPRHYANLSERDCMARAMYFESNRSSEEGMKAVGTVVMNRLKSGQYGNNICGIVGAPRQFAPGVLSNSVHGASWALAQRSADSVLRGERHARVGRAMHFHTAGYTFPYRNMAYVVAAGGNVFYEKKTPGTFTPVHPNVFVAEAQNRRSRPSDTVLMAETQERAPTPSRAPVRMARLEESEAPRSHRRPATSALAQHESDSFAPRQRPKVERVRLAHLDTEDMRKGLVTRSDAGPGDGIMLPYKAKSAGGEPVRTSANGVGGKAAPAAPAARGGIGPSVKAPAPSASLAKNATSKPSSSGAGELLAYKKTGPAPDPAKLGWKRGPDAVASTGKAKRP